MKIPGTGSGMWVLCDTLFTPHQRQTDRWLRIEGGRIIEIKPPGAKPAVVPQEMVHIPGAIVAPGFIDLHVHGASGCDLMDGTSDSVRTVSRTLAQYGTTSFFATTVSVPEGQLARSLRGLSTGLAAAEGAAPIGIHMEGPYLNPARRGTHPAAYLQKADAAEFLRLVGISGNRISRLTIAPEMDPELEVIRTAAGLGIQVSLGHSDATQEQTLAALKAGASSATHTFNAMRPFHQREPGILGVALTEDRLYTEVIADFIHVHPMAVRMLFRLKGFDRICLVTDGSSAMGMPDGNYPLGNETIRVEKGECRDSQGNLAGSALTLDCAVRNLVHRLRVPLHDAFTAAAATPARCMRMDDRKGTVAEGADADLVFLDDNLRVIQTMVNGRIVYTRLERN